MSHLLHNRSFLGELDFTTEEWNSLFELATQLKADKRAGREVKRLAGKNIAPVFEKTSTHTHCSFEVAAYDQGAQIVYLNPSGSQIGHKESVAGTARVLGRFYDGIEFRGKKQEHAEALVKLSGIPVQSGLMDEWHSTQMLIDQSAMLGRPSKSIERISFAYLDSTRNNVASSLLISMAPMGMDVRMVAPKELQTSFEVVVQAEKLTENSGARVLIADGTAQSIKGVDFLYADVWVSMSEPKEVWDQRIALPVPYQVNAQLVEATSNPDVKFLHCLPAFHDRDTMVSENIFAKIRMEGLEVADNVFETGRNVAFDQIEDHMYITKAVMVVTPGKWD